VDERDPHDAVVERRDRAGSVERVTALDADPRRVQSAAVLTSLTSSGTDDSSAVSCSRFSWNTRGRSDISRSGFVVITQMPPVTRASRIRGRST
jgi:hypothetical protein